MSLEYSMTVKLLTKQHLKFLSLLKACTGSSESIHVKMPNCWKLHIRLKFCCCFNCVAVSVLVLVLWCGSTNNSEFFGQIALKEIFETLKVRN